MSNNSPALAAPYKAPAPGKSRWEKGKKNYSPPNPRELVVQHRAGLRQRERRAQPLVVGREEILLVPEMEFPSSSALMFLILIFLLSPFLT